MRFSPALLALATIAMTNPPAVHEAARSMECLFPDPPPPRTPWRSDEEKMARAQAKRARKAGAK